MIIKQLDVEHFRSIQKIAIEPNPSLNFIIGDNGSGKSALLESIQCLSAGHSFRTRRPKELIQKGTDYFQINASFENTHTKSNHRVGLRRFTDNTVQLKFDFETLNNQSSISRIIPVKAITPDSHQLIQSSPEIRRQFIDWGLFHVEPSFNEIWQRYRKTLKQRNKLLSSQSSLSAIKHWTDQLAEYGEQLSQARFSYVNELQAELDRSLNLCDNLFHVKLAYKQGWSDNKSLADQLHQNTERHLLLNTTSDGPHRADLDIRVNDLQAKNYLSRGEQKKLVYELHLAQLQTFRSATSQKPIIICDDLSSELDRETLLETITRLLAADTQLFISGVDPIADLGSDSEVFHMERGALKKTL